MDERPEQVERISGVAASEGVAVGSAFAHVVEKFEPERERIPEDAAEAELERFRGAVEAVAPKLAETGGRLWESGSEEEAGVFEAHVEMARDSEELHSEVEEHVRRLESPEAGVLAAGEGYAKMFATMHDASTWRPGRTTCATSPLR